MSLFRSWLDDRLFIIDEKITLQVLSPSSKYHLKFT